MASHLRCACVKTIDDIMLMQVKPWFSPINNIGVGKDFLKRENGGRPVLYDLW